MNVEIQIMAIAGLVVIFSIPIAILVIASVWGDRIGIPKYSFWMAAVMCIFPIFLYAILVFGTLGDADPESLVGTIGFCLTGTIFAVLIFFLGSFIREAFVRSLKEQNVNSEQRRDDL